MAVTKETLVEGVGEILPDDVNLDPGDVERIVIGSVNHLDRGAGRIISIN